MKATESMVTLARVNLKKEGKLLTAYEKKLHPKSDRADTVEYWDGSRSSWILFNDICAGSTAVWPNMRFTDGEDWGNKPGWLYLGSLGLEKKFRKKGIEEIVIGRIIAYAKRAGFRAISTNERISSPILELLRAAGFEAVRSQEGYFESPDEVNVILELKLK